MIIKKINSKKNYITIETEMEKLLTKIYTTHFNPI